MTLIIRSYRTFLYPKLTWIHIKSITQSAGETCCVVATIRVAHLDAAKRSCVCVWARECVRLTALQASEACKKTSADVTAERVNCSLEIIKKWPDLSV